jgi:hypothetical protein
LRRPEAFRRRRGEERGEESVVFCSRISLPLFEEVAEKVMDSQNGLEQQKVNRKKAVEGHDVVAYHLHETGTTTVLT